MEIGTTGVSNLAPERPPQSAKPAQAASDSGPSSVGSDHVKVRPVANLKALEFVQILDFSASEMEPAPQVSIEEES